MDQTIHHQTIIEKAANAHDMVVKTDEVEKVIKQHQPNKTVRLGAVLDAIKSHQGQKARPKSIEIGKHKLNTVHHEWHNPDQTIIKLTEKETDILLMLWQAKGQSVSRDTLLTAIWGYVSDTETHTLETHIYRLRQKIEDDPSAHAIIITADDGYYLAF